MKRAIALFVVVICAVGFYFFIYPHLSGGSSAATNASSSTPGSAAGGKSGGRNGGGFPVSVTTAVAMTQTIPITTTAVGFIESPEVAVVRARVDGLVIQQSVTEGQTVKAGDLLFKLDDTSAQAGIAKDQALIAKDTATEAAAQLDLSRDQDLLQKQAGTQQAVDQQTAVVKGDQATLLIDQAQLKSDQLTLSYMTITAPIGGRVGAVNTSVGNIVRAADTSASGLLSITEMSPLRASFPVAERDLEAFRAALAKGNAPVQILAPGDSKPRATGTLSFIDSSVDPSSGTVVMKADISAGTDQLWPGQYVSAVTQTGAYSDVTTVPLVAVQQSSNGPYVFVVDGGGKVHKTAVTVVASVGDTAVVGSEIKPGDHVVTEGQLRLADGSTVKEASGVQTADATATGSGGSGGTATAGTHKGGKRSAGASSSAATDARSEAPSTDAASGPAPTTPPASAPAADTSSSAQG